MTTLISTTTSTKTVRLKTNLNNKIGCPRICHIQIGTQKGITDTEAEKTIFNFITQDASHPPTLYQVTDSIRVPLSEISSAFTWLSHNMNREDFIIKVLKEVPGAVIKMEMVIYFYHLISATE